MKNSFVFDTSFISAFVYSPDAFHKQAEQVYNKLPETFRLFIPATVLLELSLFDAKSQTIIDDMGIAFLESHKNFNLVEINQEFLTDFKNFVSTTGFKLKPNDYSILFTAYSQNAKLITFDENLLVYAKALKVNF